MRLRYNSIDFDEEVDIFFSSTYTGDPHELNGRDILYLVNQQLTQRYTDKPLDARFRGTAEEMRLARMVKERAGFVYNKYGLLIRPARGEEE
tara:strand:- start:40854 stop:41129 length:276 start_codon:yes stop_codon:yes gene_type:complete